MYQIVNCYHENTKTITEFKAASRFLWDDHVSYTRNAIVSILSVLPDLDAISARLIRNQEDIGTFISPYYSTMQVDTFVNLLKQHINIAVDVVEGKEGAESSWRSNGNDLVSYMNEMNPMFWPETYIGPMWTDHLNMTIAQVTSRKSELWGDDIKVYDLNHQHMSKFSDLFSTGVIYQNIDNFCLRDDKWIV